MTLNFFKTNRLPDSKNRKKTFDFRAAFKASSKKDHIRSKIFHSFLLPPAILLVSFIALILLDGTLTSFRFKRSSPSLKIYDSEDNLIYESVKDLDGYQTPVSLEEMSSLVIDSVVSLEDKRFYSHFGFDLLAMLRAFRSNLKAQEIVSGGSTLTQQVARNSLKPLPDFIPGGNNKYVRKLREINSAIFLEVFYSKDQILEKYLNSIYLGNMRYGVESASNYYFNKKSEDLSLPEAALLTGMISSPEAYDPIRNAVRAKERRNQVIDVLAAQDVIDKQEVDSLRDLPLGVNPLTTEDLRSKMHFIEYSIEEAKSKLDSTQLDGLKIYTTLDSHIAENAWRSSFYKVEELSTEHKLSNAASVVLDNSNSAILSMIGSVDYFNEDIDGSVNVATSLRQPGSALKPITYAQAFYKGVLDPNGTILDEKTVFVDAHGKSFTPHNYNGVFNGEVSVRTALASSLNLPAVKVLEKVGVVEMVDAAQRLGIHSLDNPERYGLSVTLGGGEVTLLELTNSYSSFGRGGVYKEPYSIRKVLNSKDEILYEHEPDVGQEVWGERSKEISDTIFSILSSPSDKVLGFGRNNVLNLPFQAASKTGTTTDWHDNWTLGYTQDFERNFCVGVWVGNTDNEPMSSISGVTGAGPIWRMIMLDVYDHFAIASRVENEFSEETPEQIDSKEEDKTEKATPEKPLQITNPTYNEEFFLTPGQEQYERISFEVSARKRETPGKNNLGYVEFILDGEFLAKVDETADFRFLWLPQKGEHTLEAVFYSLEGKIISRDSANFQVLKGKP